MAKTETKIIEIRIDLLKGLKDIAELQKKIETLTAANKENDKSTASLRNQYAANSVAIKDYRQQLNTLIKESANEIRTTVQKTGHIEKLKAEVSNLVLQYERLTKAELESSKGTQVLANLKGKREELAKLKAAYGDNTLNVGNYASATKMLGINIGQVMKEMPNFAISARIGIMSLTNNLPMLAETIKQVRVEQLAMIEAGKKAPSMFSLISKSVFGLTGVMSILMVLMQIYGGDIIEWVGKIFQGKDALDAATLSQKEFNDMMENGNSIITNSKEKVLEVESAFRQYKNGIISAEEALKIYNENLGDNLGKHTDINSAMTAFNELAPKYIEWSLKMAIAEKMKEKAADATLKRILAERKGEEEYSNWFQETFIGLDVAFGKSRQEAANVIISERKRRKNNEIESTKAEEDAYTELYKTLTDDAKSFAKLYGILSDENANKSKGTSTKVTETMLRQFDYESKIMEERAKAMEVGRERELAAIDADYNAKLVKSQQHIERLKQQEAAGVKGAKEARIQAEKDQEAYELALEEGKGRKKIEINLKYDKLQADNALAELKHQHDMMMAENELSAKEQYDLTVKYAEDEYIAKMAQLDLMNISEEEYIIKSTELWNQRQLAIANGEKKLTNDLHSENLARLNNELAALTTGKDAQFQDIDAVFNKKTETLNAQKAKELEAAGTNAELIKSIEAKYAAESIALEQWKITSKIEKYKFWADTALNVGSEVNKAITAFAEHELSVWAKANEGKANFDIEYEKKKIELQRKEAIREKALAVMNTTINTAAAIVGFLAKPSGLAGAALSVAAGITGAAQIAAILATPLPSMSSSSVGSSPEVSKRTVTEKFHSGGTIGTTTGEEKPITALTGESVNTIATTQMFSPILSALNQIGGGKAITSGVNTSMGTDMLAAAFSKALRQMPAPRIIWSDFETASERQRMIENNRLVR